MTATEASFIELKKEFNIRAYHFTGAFLGAAIMGDIKKLEECLGIMNDPINGVVLKNCGIDINVRTIKEKKSALYLTVVFEKYDAAKFLLANKADVNATDEDGLTSLHCAAKMNNKKMINLLLKNGANVYAETRFGQLPSDMAKIFAGNDSEVYKTLKSAEKRQMEKANKALLNANF